ncbi:hypothetical protein BHM03_00031709 [Ensete ventricosum]|nr:hypothetical protein BHM03_00031709 [Ensete ventricosum]
MERRSGAVVVTSSPVDLEPKPLAPVDPIRFSRTQTLSTSRIACNQAAGLHTRAKNETDLAEVHRQKQHDSPMVAHSGPSLRHVMPHSGYGGGLAVGDHIPHFTLTNPSHPVAL